MTTVKAVDLFAGAGGLSRGCEMAGAAVVLAVEASQVSAETYASNHPKTRVLRSVIGKNFDLRDHLAALSDSRCDLLVGGPPCQGWSSLGPRGGAERRASLNACIDRFLEQVRRVKPPAVLMENVRGLATRDGGRHIERVVRSLRRCGYNASWFDVRAADYGLPQLRHRVFVVATARELGVRYELPLKTQSDLLTVWDAIGDLPSLGAGEKRTSYVEQPSTAFQRAMRGQSKKLRWHEAPCHSDRILNVLAALRSEGASRSSLGSEIVLTSGFHNTYCRLDSRAPAPAVTSSAGRISSGRNAHPFDDRALTPREAARLQGFPDSYIWKGHRWRVYEQIGNAVPPLLAMAVARPLIESLAVVL